MMDNNANKKLTDKTQESVNEDTQAMNAIAKALMVSAAWSLAGLKNSNDSTKAQSESGKVWVNLRPLAE
ncbi:MAG: hypothetical protein AAFO04_10415 [Cyanobacteria bacterium J06592_8]